jgi:hypothetical protein
MTDRGAVHTIDLAPFNPTGCRPSIRPPAIERLSRLHRRQQVVGIEAILTCFATVVSRSKRILSLKPEKIKTA